ncbi:hypothetical protein QKW52_12780 [Bacillus sonorensis]|nr:hypothetical protein [Bacillus sonorensis]
MSWAEQDATGYHVIKPDEVEAALQDAGASIQYRIEVTGIPVSLKTDNMRWKQLNNQALMISENDFNKAAEKNTFRLSTVEKRGGVYQPFLQLQQ